MSVWHETQIEFAGDAVDELIEAQGETLGLAKVKEFIRLAYAIAEDLPDNKAESIRMLEFSNKLLETANKHVPTGDEKLIRRLRNKIVKAQEAIQETIKEILAM